MLFVALLKTKSGTYKEVVDRRIQRNKQSPRFIVEGLNILEEYWPMTSDPSCIMILEADSVDKILIFLAGWDQYFDYTVVPAVTGKHGLSLAEQIMER